MVKNTNNKANRQLNYLLMTLVLKDQEPSSLNIKFEFKKINDEYKKKNKDLSNVIDYIYSKLEDYKTFIEKWMEKVVERKDIIIPSIKDSRYTVDEYLSFHRSDTKDSIKYVLIFILSIRQIIHNYLKDNAKHTLNAKDEFLNYKKKDKRYIVNIIDTELDKKVYSIFIFLFYLECFSNFWLRSSKKHKTRNYVCIDLEFNKKEMGMMQLNYEGKYYANILLTNPKSFPEFLKNLFNVLILENRFILKILHGSDSLDIPNIYTEVLQGNRESIIKFTKSMVDTRFLCEYHKTLQKNIQPKCSIYNALLDYKVISQEKFGELEKITENMGPVQDVPWYLHTISKMQIIYALYDVLHLKYLYQNIFKVTKLEGTHVYMGIHFIPEITQFIYLERRGITDIISKCKKFVDPINNYIVKKDNVNTMGTMINVFSNILKLEGSKKSMPSLEKSHIVLDNGLDLTAILNVNLFKSLLIILLKYVTYSYLTHNFKISRDKQSRYDQKLKLDWLFEELKIIKLNYIKSIIEDFIKFIKTKL